MSTQKFSVFSTCTKVAFVSEFSEANGVLFSNEVFPRDMKDYRPVVL